MNEPRAPSSAPPASTDGSRPVRPSFARPTVKPSAEVDGSASDQAVLQAIIFCMPELARCVENPRPSTTSKHWFTEKLGAGTSPVAGTMHSSFTQFDEARLEADQNIEATPLLYLDIDGFDDSDSFDDEDEFTGFEHREPSKYAPKTRSGVSARADDSPEKLHAVFQKIFENAKAEEWPRRIALAEAAERENYWNIPHLVSGELNHYLYGPDQPLDAFGLTEGQPWHLHLQYQFSDGTVCNAREICFYRAASQINYELLPVVLDEPEAPEFTPWIDLLPIKHDTTHRPQTGEAAEKSRLEQARVLYRILCRAIANPELQVFITSSTQFQEPRAAFLVERVESAPEHQLKGTFESSPHPTGLLHLLLEHKGEPLPGYYFERFVLDPARRSITLIPSGRQLWAFLTAFKYELVGASNQYRWPTPYAETTGLPQCLVLNLRHYPFTREILTRVTEAAPTLPFPITPLPMLHPVGPPVPQLHLSLGGEVRFCQRVELPGETLRVWNFPYELGVLLQGLGGGLASCSGGQAKALAQNRRGAKRDRDLKVFKHSGIFSLIVLELATYCVSNTLFGEKTVLNTRKEFFKALYIKLGTLLRDLEKKAGFVDSTPSPSLDKLCSASVIQSIEQFANHHLNLFESKRADVPRPNALGDAPSGRASYNEIYHEIAEGLILVEDGGFQLLRSGRWALLFMGALIAKVALESKGQCFTKPRLNPFAGLSGDPKELDPLQPCFWPWVEHLSESATVPSGPAVYSPVNQWMTPVQILHALTPLTRSGFEIFYNGLPLDSMNLGDFKPVFDLKEGAPNEADPETPPDEVAIDWFELHPKFFFKGVELDGGQFEQMSRDGLLTFEGRVYLIPSKNIPSMKRLENFWNKIQGVAGVNRYRGAERYLRLPRHQTLEMLAMRASGVSVTGGARWKQICTFYDSLSNREKKDFFLPPEVQADLKPYQKLGIQWLLDLHALGLGGILADDMGLGKTVQTLVFLETLRHRKEMGHVLIVVPTSLTFNWRSEAERFTPHLPAFIFHSKLKEEMLDQLRQSRESVIICTYGLFTEHEEFFTQQSWSVLIFDEAQNLKNIASKRTTASRRVPARFKLALTGTPLENHMGEFFSLVDLVVPGSLGELSSFREKFVVPDQIEASDLNYLKLKARPLILRRTKGEILAELPPKQETTIRLPFEVKQERIYRDIALAWNAKVKQAILRDGESKSQILMLTALLRLRQACSDPGSIPNVKYDIEPPKSVVLLEALQEITHSGESALVFTQFLHTFEKVKKKLIATGIETYSLHGGTSRAERERILQSFGQSKRGAVLLMTLKTGGVGLNLVKASYVFHLEPWWNPAVENQATDRAHRMGQRRPVQVYRYLMRESVEEKIEILKHRKSAKFEALFSTNEVTTEVTPGGALLSQTDFEYLLS